MGIDGPASRIARYCVTAAGAVLISCAPGRGAPIRDGAALKVALQRAKGGEELRLAPGTFGDLRIDNRTFTAAVTIVSDNAAEPATIERLILNGVTGLHFRALEIGGQMRAGEAEYSKIAEVRGSTDIRFDRVFVHGSRDGDPGNDIWGAYFGDCGNVTVAGSRFEEVMRGVVFERSHHIALTDSVFHLIRSDGADFASVQKVSIERNRFSSFHPVGTDHADAIQFWTLKGPPSTDIVIADNILLEGEGTGPQGIFMNAARTGPYRRIQILNNLLYSSGAWQGILVEGAEEVVIRGNTTLSRQDDDKVFWISLSDVSSLELDGNVTDRLILKDVRNLKQGRNVNLTEAPWMAKRIKGLNMGSAATAESLTISGEGYQPPANGKGMR